MLGAVIFDMDGLLIDSEPLWHRAEQRVFAPLGLALTTEMCLRTTGVRIDAVVRYWYRRHPWKGRSLEQVADDIVAEVHQLALTEGQALPGVRETLELLRATGLPLALASSSPLSLIEAVVDKLNIAEYFSLLCSAADENHGKPHPAVYLRTARQLGVAPQACLAFEDSFPGVIAAKAADMRVVAVPGQLQFAEPRFAAADLKLASLRDFTPEVLERLRRNWLTEL